MTVGFPSIPRFLNFVHSFYCGKQVSLLSDPETRGAIISMTSLEYRYGVADFNTQLAVILMCHAPSPPLLTRPRHHLCLFCILIRCCAILFSAGRRMRCNRFPLVRRPLRYFPPIVPFDCFECSPLLSRAPIPTPPRRRISLCRSTRGESIHAAALCKRRDAERRRVGRGLRRRTSAAERSARETQRERGCALSIAGVLVS